MPGNPLTDPNWPVDLADTVERVVGTVRAKATTPAVHVVRGIVYGVIAGCLAVAALILGVIGVTRGLQSLFGLFLPWDQAVYVSYLVLGGILCLGGALLFRTRQTS